MANIQLVQPNTNATDATGMCLRFTQRVYQNLNPIYYNSAWDAWNGAQFKGQGNVPTDISVPVYFSHYGTYGNPPTYANWGHVVAWIPGRGYLSSPAGGYGQQWFDSVEQIAWTFNAKYAGWAYDVGGLLVAKTTSDPNPSPAPQPTLDEGDDIMAIYLTPTGNSSPGKDGTSRIWAGERVLGDGAKYSNVWERSEDGTLRRLFPQEWVAIQAAYTAAGRKVPVASIAPNELEKMAVLKRSAIPGTGK